MPLRPAVKLHKSIILGGKSRCIAAVVAANTFCELAYEKSR